MKLIIKLFFILIIVSTENAMCTIISTSTTATLIPNEQEDYDNHGEEPLVQVHNHDQESSSSDQIHQVERLFWLKKRTYKRPTCKRFPRICLSKGSPGPSCCKKKCVDLMRDRHNCGKCGKKCKYNHLCCNGKCINPSFNKRHCGGCNKMCSNGGLCAFGLCSYA